MFQNFMKYANYGLQALMLLPTLITMVHGAIEAVEQIGGPGPAKKEAVLGAIGAVFDVVESTTPGALGLDKPVLLDLSGKLVETQLGLSRAAPKKEVAA